MTLPSYKWIVYHAENTTLDPFLRIPNAVLFTVNNERSQKPHPNKVPVRSEVIVSVVSFSACVLRNTTTAYPCPLRSIVKF